MIYLIILYLNTFTPISCGTLYRIKKERFIKQFKLKFKRKMKQIQKKEFKKYIEIIFWNSEIFLHNNLQVILNKDKDIKKFKKFFLDFCKENNIKI
jgi:hypothetical protein